MRRPLPLLALALLLVAAAPPPLEGEAMVAADHELASQAGAQALARGGNAVDACVAAALAAGVVQPSASGLGGGGFAVVQRDGQTSVLDFREVAPAAATRDMFIGADGKVVPGLSTKSGKAVAVPAEGRGLAALLERFGSLSAKAVSAPAVRLAAKGFPLGPHLLGSLEAFPGLREQLFDPEGRRPALARTLKAWASSGGEALYSGAIAEDLVAATAAQGGVLALADLAAYQPKDREVLVGHYRGYTVLTMPPPSSGGAVLLQALAVLESKDLKALGHNSSDHVHLLAEVMKHAYADRAHFMGDPDFVQVPVDRMLAPARVEEIRASITEGPRPSSEYGLPVAVPPDAGTHHISVVDAQGDACALTTTVNTSFGSGIVAPRSGILLNNQMDDFVAQPGVPNAFGLVGLESNAVQAGKRPLSSMTPTILLDPQGQVVMVIGASGGPFIISSTLQVLSNIVDFDMDPEEAVSAPRMHHQWLPDVLMLDAGLPRDVARALEARGHTLKEMPFFSAVQVIWRGEHGLQGASDPRKGGRPALP